MVEQLARLEDVFNCLNPTGFQIHCFMLRFSHGGNVI